MKEFSGKTSHFRAGGSELGVIILNINYCKRPEPGTLFRRYFRRRDYDEIQAYVRKSLAIQVSEEQGQKNAESDS